MFPFLQRLRSIGNDSLLWLCNYRVAQLPSHRLRLWFYRRVMRFEIGQGSSIFRGVWFDSRSRLRIGNNTTINQRCRLDTRANITIGNSVSISAEVCILTADHDLKRADFAGRWGPVSIGDHVFVGTRVMILPGVSIGEGAAVAAGSVVVREVAPFTIVAGVPARPIGTRPTNLDYTVTYRRWFQ